jgi:phosphohistidine phosphatase SixA
MKTILLVRHGEYDPAPPPSPPPPPGTPKGPSLNAAGQKRAETLAQVLAAADVRRIFVSDYARTQQTADPLADKLGIDWEIQTDEEKVAQEIRTSAAAGSLLVVGHSNTVPEIIRKLGGVLTFPGGDDIPPDLFDNLFVLTLGAMDAVGLVNLKYGKASP